MNNKVFKNKKVLITGHTGFKGSWLSIWLSSLGAKIIGVSSNIPSTPSNFEASAIKEFVIDYRADISDSVAINRIIEEHQPDFCFHMAAQALVRESYNSPLATLTTNAIGSANLLDAVKHMNKKVIVIMITSDKAYDNVEWAWGYRETDRIGGKDPYSASKGMAEIAIRSYVESFFSNDDSNVRVGITRAGNVIGGGDWAIDRIVPDCIKAWSDNKIVKIRNPNSTRPWQHVLEPLSGYISLAANLAKTNQNHGEAFNFGPLANQNYPVSSLINEIAKHWDKVKWKDISVMNQKIHEAGLLKLNCDKALFKLNWQSTLDFKETVEMTIDWYKYYYDNRQESMYEFTLNQIQNYQKIAKERHISWANYD